MVAPPKPNTPLRLTVANSVDDPPDGKGGAGGPVRFQQADEHHTAEEDG